MRKYTGETSGERKAIVEAEDWDGVAYQTCRDAAWIAAKFDLSRRRDNLSFSHRTEVATYTAVGFSLRTDENQAVGRRNAIGDVAIDEIVASAFNSSTTGIFDACVVLCDGRTGEPEDRISQNPKAKTIVGGDAVESRHFGSPRDKYATDFVLVHRDMVENDFGGASP